MRHAGSSAGSSGALDRAVDPVQASEALDREEDPVQASEALDPSLPGTSADGRAEASLGDERSADR